MVVLVVVIAKMTTFRPSAGEEIISVFVQSIYHYSEQTLG